MRRGGMYVAMGDSITWAVAAGATKGGDFYATKIRDAIRANYGPVRLINKGIGGATSADMVQNLPWLLEVVPDLVTIGVGMNDCSLQGVPVADYQNNLRKIVDAIRRRNPNVVIILCTPSRTTDPNRTPYIDDYRAAMAAVATEKGVALCRFEDAWAQEDTATYCSDNPAVHPNASGHALLYGVLWPVVQSAAATWLATLGK